MSRRLKVTKDGIIVVGPGYDADTATLDQMTFNSQLAAVNRSIVGMALVVRRQFVTVTTSNAIPVTTTYFGKTFPYPPFFAYIEEQVSTSAFDATRANVILTYRPPAMDLYGYSSVGTTLYTAPTTGIYAAIFEDHVDWYNFNQGGDPRNSPPYDHYYDCVRWMAYA
ncbi:MAG TPA: hypothetical protein VKT73_13190 [Xanthobacteraceae bacterium]|nr:hypothetical protein [Xanthobacteraceae bacterium]